MKAPRSINAGLEYFALKPEDLQTLMKGDERKLALAVLGAQAHASQQLLARSRFEFRACQPGESRAARRRRSQIAKMLENAWL